MDTNAVYRTRLKNKPLYIGVFLAGAVKCGTTTISDWLFQHPQITPVRKDPAAQAKLATMEKTRNAFPFLWNMKEPAIMFSLVQDVCIHWDGDCLELPMHRKRGGLIKKYVKRGFDAQLARCLPDTPQTRPDGWQSLAADCSPAYFRHAGTEKAIKKLYPDARVLIALRHPTDWVHSHHYMEVRKGRKEPLFTAQYSFARHKRKATLKSLSRLLAAHFSANLTRWIKTFGKQGIKVIILEEWRRQPEKTAQECYRFIGVDDTFVPQARHCESADKLRYPVSCLARQYHKLASFHARHHPRYRHIKYPVVEKWAWVGSRIGLYDCRPPMPDQLRRQMDEHFQPQVEAIETILGRKIPAWHRDYQYQVNASESS